MIERPLLLHGPQVRAFQEGRQTQDRRPIKFPQSAFIPDTSWIKSIHQDGGGNWIAWGPDNPDGLKEFTKKAYPNGEGFPCPFGREGDRLWIRETWATPGNYDHVKPSDLPNHIGCEIVYRATEPYPLYYHWRPSIHMPRWASRLTLEIERVRVERVQSISEDDAMAEGLPNWINHVQSAPLVRNAEFHKMTAVEWFLSLWDSIYAKTYPWSSNPWVWAMDLKVVDATPKS